MTAVDAAADASPLPPLQELEASLAAQAAQVAQAFGHALACVRRAQEGLSAAPPPAASHECLAAAVGACHDLFAFLLERVLAHQLACHAMLDAAAAALPPPPPASPSPAAKALAALRQCASAAPRRQALTLLCVRRGAPDAAAERAAKFTFAVPTGEAAEVVRAVHAVGGAAVLLPPAVAACEESAAALLGCRYLVSDAPAAAPADGAAPAAPAPLLRLPRAAVLSLPSRAAAAGDAETDDDDMDDLLQALDRACAAPPPGSPREDGGLGGTQEAVAMTRDELLARGAASMLGRRRPRPRSTLTMATAASTPATAAPSPQQQEEETAEPTDGWGRHTSAEAASRATPQQPEGDGGDDDTDSLPLTAVPPQSQRVTYAPAAPEPELCAEEAAAVARVEALPPAEWVFQVSYQVQAQRAELLEAIARLGSRFDDSKHFSPRATHLVAAEGLTERTEKYLGACAARTLIVTPRYVFDSLRRGRWVLGRMSSYSASPRRRQPSAAAPFAAWRVLLLAGRAGIARGISNVLAAGGCRDCQTCLFLPHPPQLSDDGRLLAPPGPPVGAAPDGCTADLTANARFAAGLVESRTHLLVECAEVSARSPEHFRLPQWFPVALMRAELYGRLFTLELLYYCLCTARAPVFDADTGALIAEDRLQAACRVEPFS